MDVNRLYDKIAYRKLKDKDFEPYDGNNGRVNKCVRLITAGILNSSGNIVDVGGGIGDLCYAVRDLFEKKIVLDISHDNLKAAYKKLNCENDENSICLISNVDQYGLSGNKLYLNLHDKDNNEIGYVLSEYERQKVEDGSVDLVTALDFIEHIVDPEYFAEECYRVLKSGGQVFINTPNIQFFRHIASLLFTDNFPHTSGDNEVFHGGHLAFYTFGDLRQIFRNAGFKNCEQIMDEEGYEDPPQWLWSLVSGRINMTNQKEFVEWSRKYGCPNILFKCEK